MREMANTVEVFFSFICASVDTAEMRILSFPREWESIYPRDPHFHGDDTIHKQFSNAVVRYKAGL